MRRAFLLLSHVASASADLTCLSWGIYNPYFGLFCHFKRSAFNSVENATVDAVRSFVHDTKDVLDFAVTYHPAVLAYDYVKTATHSTAEANSQLAGQVRDIVNVDIGFTKEAANMVGQRTSQGVIDPYTQILP